VSILSTVAVFISVIKFCLYRSCVKTYALFYLQKPIKSADILGIANVLNVVVCKMKLNIY